MTPDEFDAFYRASVRRLVGQVYALTGDHGDAQDLVHEAFARAWDRRHLLPGVRNPEAWVFTVAAHLATSRWRRARSALTAYRRHGPPEPVPGPGPDAVALARALAELPHAQRVAIVLHHLADLPIDEVAARTEVPVGTVKARLSRGRRALAVLLTDPLPDPTTASEAHRG